MSARSLPSPEQDGAPAVSVILPVRNEERHLEAAVRAILSQRYDGVLEIVLAVGPSTDRTAEIAARLGAADDRVVVVGNPSGRTPSALNRAIAAAHHDVLVRVDGHSEISQDYVARAVDVLLATGAANVGGRMLPVGMTDFERAVARAMSHPLGIGAERFHTGGAPGPAPTVYLGVFRREDVEEIGCFDERFVRAQDWELNHRLRAAGKVVWFDPDLVVTYRPRGSWTALARQFYGTGRWRRQVIRRYPTTASVRYLAAPAAVVAVSAGTVAGLVALTVGNRPGVAGLLAPLTYGAVVVVGSAVAGRGLSWRSRMWLPGVIGTMHMAWGAGFIRGLGREGAEPRVYPGAAHGAPAAREARRTAAPHRPED